MITLVKRKKTHMLVINPVVTMKIYVWAKLIDEHMPFDTTNWKKEKKKKAITG